MSMDDWGWSEDDGQDRKAPPGAMLDPGTYTAQIDSAKWERKKSVPEKWAAKNPEGWRISLSMSVHHDGRRYQFFADVPRHWRWMFEDIAAATGTSLPDSPEWQPTDWVGCDVRIETGIWESNNGPRIEIKKWLAAPAKAATAPAAKPPARTAAAKVKAAAAEGGHEVPADDIPFLWLLPFIVAAATLGGLA